MLSRFWAADARVYMTSECDGFKGGFASKRDEKADVEVEGGIAFVIERGRCVEKNDARWTSTGSISHIS